MGDHAEIRFGKRAVQKDFLSAETLKASLEELRKMRKAGRRVSLGDILVQQGLLTPAQVREILREQKKEILICPSCHLRYNVAGFNPDKSYNCKKCGGRLGYQPDEAETRFDRSAGRSAADLHAFTVDDHIARQNRAFGQMAVQKAYLTSEQLNEVLRLCGDGGMPIGEYCVAEGLLHVGQVEEILDEQNKQILKCAGCQRRFAVRRDRKNNRVCPECGEPLVVPEDGSVIEFAETGEKPKQIDPMAATIVQESQRPLPSGERSAGGGSVFQQRLREIGIRTDVNISRSGSDSDHGSSSDFSGKYAVAGEINRGGMGIILDGHDMDIHRELAIKVMLGDRALGPDRIARFVEEAQIQGQLEHPNICPVHELGIDGNDRFYFTMKKVRGRSLGEILEALAEEDEETVASYPLMRLMDIFSKVCDAVAFAHARGVIHRDLKPDNIMIGEFGEVQMMDWGLAKIMGSEDRTEPALVVSDRMSQGHLLSMDGSIIGTPAYMPPEQAEGRISEMDERSDVYALGGILYAILTLRAPVAAPTVGEILEKVKTGKIVAPSRRTPSREIPMDLEAVALQAMAKRREDRYASVVDLRNDIAAFVEGRALSAAEYSAAQLVGMWVRRNRMLTGAIAACVVALIAGFFIMAQVQATQRAGQVQALVEDADGMMESGKAEQAFEKLMQALALDPSVEGQIRGRIAEASAQLETDRKRMASHEQAGQLASKAREAMARQEWKNAYEQLLAAYALSPDFKGLSDDLAVASAMARQAELEVAAAAEAEGLLASADELFNVGNHSDAYKAYLKAHGLAPGAFKAEHEERMQASASHVAAALLSEADRERIGNLLTEAGQKMGEDDVSGAYELAIGVLAIDPDNPDARELFEMLSERKRAIDLKDEIVKLISAAEDSAKEAEHLAEELDLEFRAYRNIRGINATHTGALKKIEMSKMTLRMRVWFGLIEETVELYQSILYFDRSRRDFVDREVGKLYFEVWRRTADRGDAVGATWALGRLKSIGDGSVYETYRDQIEVNGTVDYKISNLPDRHSLWLFKYELGWDGRDVPVPWDPETGPLFDPRDPVKVPDLARHDILSSGSSYHWVMDRDFNLLEENEGRMELPAGSYVLVVSNGTKPGTRVPFMIRRGALSVEVDLPDPEKIPDGFEYIPPGTFVMGGDAFASGAFEGQLRNMDYGFLMAKEEVSLDEYIVFLKEVLPFNEPDVIKHLVPDPVNVMSVQITEDKKILLSMRFKNMDGWPALGVSQIGAGAFAQWKEDKTGLKYRLPSEYEWEWAARGADGRFFPWGGFFNPTFCRMKDSQAGEPFPGPMFSRRNALLKDESPFGIWDMAGGVCEWTGSPYDPNKAVDDMDAQQVIRGGCWGWDEGNARAAFRFGTHNGTRGTTVGFRLVIDIED